jgi:3-oxoacyl-[acyl-carrier-protein] synthase-3
MDVNTACTSFLYALSTATAMIRSGVVQRALVVGGEVISPLMDWSNRNVAVLFGDGCAAVVLEASDVEQGVLAEKLGCDAAARGTLVIQGMGSRYADCQRRLGVTDWVFEGQEIFKRAVLGMSDASTAVLAAHGVSAAELDLVVPHQANLRIIEAVAKRVGLPAERVFTNVHRYGNMSAATVPVALVEALEEGRVPAHGLLLLPAFGAGLTWCAHLLRWGPRITPLGVSDVQLPPCTQTALQLVQSLAARRAAAVASPV